MNPKKKKKEWNPKKNKLSLLVFLMMPLAIYFLFGIIHISEFETADEHFWIKNDRIHQYWKAASEKDWKKTRINDKPGITLAYASGIGMVFEKNIQEKNDQIFTQSEPKAQKNNFFYFRIPLLIFIGILSLVIFFLIKKLTENFWISIFTFSFILLSPTIIGISQIVNPDSLYWIFFFSTILSFFIYLKNCENKMAVLTSVFLAFTFLSKHFGVILLPFLFFSIIAYLVFNIKRWQDQEIKSRMIGYSLAYFFITFFSFAIFSIFMPAVFVKKKYLFDGLLGFQGIDHFFYPILAINLLIFFDAFRFKAKFSKYIFGKIYCFKEIILKFFIASALFLFIFSMLNWSFNLNIFNLDVIPFDAREDTTFNGLPFYQKFLLQARPVVFSLTPIVLFFLIYVWIKSLFSKKTEQDDFILFIFTSFFIIYYSAVTYKGLLVNIRYSIALYPLAFFLASLGLWKFFKLENQHFTRKTIVFAGIIFLSVFSILSVKPFYFNYANFLLPKEKLITGAWGYGGYEAAQYLNSLPNAENIRIISDYSGVCSFVRGYCLEMSNDIKKKILEKFKEEESRDYYFVLSRRGQVRWGYIYEFNRFQNKKPDWQITIDNRPGNFVKVYKPYNQ